MSHVRDVVFQEFSNRMYDQLDLSSKQINKIRALLDAVLDEANATIEEKS